jgi:drug/metabolite transporter (DMT)-like permease
LWGIVLSFFFTETDITRWLIVGAGIIFAGMVLVIGNPKDMANLRKS